MPEFHPQEWITIVEALSVYDQWLEREARSEEIFALQLAIAREHGFESPSAFVRQGGERDGG
jgi:hypothetical protein